MNNTKKVAFAVVSTVMAGTMVFSLTACGGKDKDKDDEGIVIDRNENLLELPDKYDVVNNETGFINYDSYNRASNVTIRTAVGHNSNATSITYLNDLGREITLPDGKTYSNNSVKPAWAQMGKDLHISWEDKYRGKATNANLNDAVTAGYWDEVDLITTDLSKAVSMSADGTANILNLANYLEYMPHFQAFLNQNPIVYLSLLQSGMNTETGAGGSILVAPYFDGNDDIERYCLIRQDWADKILNGNTALTGSTAFSGSTHVEAYMGSTNYSVEILNEDGNGKTTLTKDYAAVLTAVKTADTPLYTAYNAIAGAAYSGNSGNIIDLMNAAIAANATNATGANLANLFRAYIDVCYGGHYTADKRSNLFNGYDAAWDVDDLVAMLRCVMTNTASLDAGGDTVVGITPRSCNNDRTPDMVRLAAQLYGVRGADSRYENTYIGKDGTLHDARNDKEFYEAMARMNTLKQEGLIYEYTTINDTTSTDTGVKNGRQAFMMYDYSQTQTLNGFYKQEGGATGGPSTISDDYFFGAILTPVSKWDVDGDGNHTDIMRFTESWRSTKTGGLAVNGAVAGDENKLKAVLQFVDFLYSEDGQIVSSFGPMADNATGDNGFWYNEKATDEQIENKQYFNYKGEQYSGTLYKGRYTPTLTTNFKNSFLGKTVNGFSVTSLTKPFDGASLNFTNYARKLTGATLPVGVKDQSFENQCTSQMGQTGANKVGAALAAGVVKGMTLNIDESNYWYTCVPTGLPIESDIVEVLSGSDQAWLRGSTGEVVSSNKNFYSIFNHLILFGATGSYDKAGTLEAYTITNVDSLYNDMIKNTGEGGKGATTRLNGNRSGWNTAKSYWDFLKPEQN